VMILPARTTHWVAYDELGGYGAQPTEQRVVRAGKIITGAGVSAGIDLALLVAGLAWGDDMAKVLQLAIEYDPQPPYDAGSPTKAGPDLMALVSGAVAEQEAAL